MGNSMRVMLISTNGDEAGAPRHVEFLSSCLKNEVDFFYVFGSKGPVFSRCNDIAPGRVFLLSGLASSLNPLADVLVLIRLSVLTFKVKPDIVHSHSSKAGLVARLLGLIMRTPVIHTIHGWPWREFGGMKRTLLITVEKLLANVSHAYYIGVAACVFREAQSVNLELNDRRSCVIHNTTVVSKNSKTTSSTPEAITSRYILMPARVSAAKDHLMLAKAFSMSDYDGLLVLAGGGTDGDEFKARIRSEVGAEAYGRVCFLGERSDIAELMKGADAVTLCSHFETFPLTIVEGFAMQKVVVASDIGGCAEIIRHEHNGFLANSLGEWVSVLNRLKDSESLGNVEAKARDAYEKDFDVDLYTDDMRSVYESALNSKSLPDSLKRFAS